MALLETVILPPRITHNQFGVSEEVFNRSVKGKPLKVVFDTGKFKYVEVEGEAFGIHEDDLMPDKESKVSKYSFAKDK